jgi:D-methionine transport system substrate-binding protein
MKKFLLAIVVLSLAIFSAACSSQSSSQKVASPKKSVTVKVGISGSDTRVWDFVASKAKKEGINIQIVKFSDYVLPNTALADGELDINAFQTNIYFEDFIKQHKLDLTQIGTTVIAPMGIYSDKYKHVKDIPDGSKIAVPNDVTNEGRALLLLQKAGLIKLADNFISGGVEGIVQNPKHLQIVPMVAAQTPRALPDVAASVINNGVAVDAGKNPISDSIYHETGKNAKPYINIIAAKTKDKNRSELKEIVKLFQQKDTADLIKKDYKGAQIPTFVPVSELSVKN